MQYLSVFEIENPANIFLLRFLLRFTFFSEPLSGKQG